MAARARLGPAATVLALTATVLSGCSSSGTSSTGQGGPVTADGSTSPVASSRGAAHAPTAALGSVTKSDPEMCKALTDNLDLLETITTSPNDPSLDRNIAKLRALSATAPADIRDSVAVIADFDQRLVSAVRSGKSPQTIAETPALTAALSHEAHWTATHCIYSK